MSNKPSFTDQTIRNFLLGRVNSEIKEMIELQIMTDGTFLEIIEALEEDLIDDYVDGMLSEEEKDLFESKYLTSEKVVSQIRLTKLLKTLCRVR